MPSFHHWLTWANLAIIVAAGLGGLSTMVGLPDKWPRWGWWSVLGLIIVSAVLAMYAGARNAADAEEDRREDRSDLSRIEQKIDRLKAADAVGESEPEAHAYVVTGTRKSDARPDSSMLETHVDRALETAKERAQVALATQAKSTVPNEAERAEALRQITRLYILSNDGISSRMMAGLELPPAEFINGELERQNAKWRVTNVKGASAEIYALD
ncbi:hypothetical protein QP162_05930 [Sphingomonas aurantiaca]|uniref:hypothetical protein n=1 Tax=Sphingomonas aurantiaca TaxID=185949 RepID=UPI002FDFCD64